VIDIGISVDLAKCWMANPGAAAAGSGTLWIWTCGILRAASGVQRAACGVLRAACGVQHGEWYQVVL
jgi:hypothetical protein